MAVSNYEVERGRTEAAQARVQQIERDSRAECVQLESTIDQLRAQLGASRENEIYSNLEESSHAMHLRDTIRHLEHENALQEEALRNKTRLVADLEEQVAAERRVVTALKRTAGKVGTAARELQEEHAQLRGEVRALREWQEIATAEMKSLMEETVMEHIRHFDLQEGQVDRLKQA